ncbi:hypothetical protein DL767_010625 [Monosporascus sp. MG133]|nr:hypothetical protein DL767_010625 [Monosporascus sp. MG133]
MHRPAVANSNPDLSGLEQASEHANVIHPVRDDDTEDEEYLFVYEPGDRTRLEIGESLAGVEEDISDADLEAAANQ